jgi:hypothetical protein
MSISLSDGNYLVMIYWHIYFILFFLFICREADESRLREVCENFLGPPMGMLGSASSMEPKNPSWDPDVLVSLSFPCILDSSTF